MHVITANHVRHGTVIFLRHDGEWSSDIAHAWRIGKDRLNDALKIATRAAQDGIAVGPYEVAVKDDGGTVTPARFRERLRLSGPSVETRGTPFTPFATGANGSRPLPGHAQNDETAPARTPPACVTMTRQERSHVPL